MTEIPIANPQVSEAAKEAVCDVLDSSMLADGDVVRSFESEFAEYVGVDHAVATSSGTTALHAMLEAAGIGEGDAVVTTPFSFVASANAIVHAGAKPAFADIDPETYNLDPATVRRVVEERDDVAAILAVHLYGLPAAMDDLRAIADEHDLWLFEDAAQAHGATFDGEPVGSIGDASAFSFYPTKNMTTSEGGMVTTDDGELAERLRRVVDHGRAVEGDHGYEHVEVGYNYRMTNVAAAIGREQLKQLPTWVQERQRTASKLSQELSEIEGVQTPSIPEGRTHAFHQYTIQVPARDRLVETLEECDVGYGVYYPSTIPEQPAFDGVVEDPGDAVASELADRVISLPVHPYVDEDDVTTISNAVRSALADAPEEVSSGA